MTDSEIELFISKCKIFISFMLHQQQWSGLTKLEIDNWVANFEPANSKESGTASCYSCSRTCSGN